MSRYSRHIILPEVGPVGQVKLLEAKVLVIGAGGLGLPVLQYLAAAGVGRLGIVDHDNVSISNLQRQVLFREQDLDQNKAEVAQKLLALRNSQIQIEAHPVFLTPRMPMLWSLRMTWWWIVPTILEPGI